jgi:hypothetical protein
MQNGLSSQTTLKQKVTDEAKEFSLFAAYLFICFAALAYLKAANLAEHGIAFSPFGFAAVKALICAKFMSIGHAFHLGERFKTRALIWPTLYKASIYLVLLLVLNGAEEIIDGFLHHRSIADSLYAISGGSSLHQLIAASIVGLLILLPFFAFSELGEVVGKHNLMRLFFEPRQPRPSTSSQHNNLSP